MKNSTKIIGAVVVVVVIVGGIAFFHMSPKPAASNKDTSNTTTTSNAILVTKTSSSLGNYLAEPNGDPLYTYNGDTSGVSNVTGSLLASWPAYQDKGSTTGLPSGVSTIKRTDNGQIQYTYNGMPLYTFVADSSGNVTGNGVSNFVVAKPTASSSSQSTTPATTTSSSSSSSSSW
jgi:predicted lipoprotein with Yx(FWY)xxD motif